MSRTTENTLFSLLDLLCSKIDDNSTNVAEVESILTVAESFRGSDIYEIPEIRDRIQRMKDYINSVDPERFEYIRNKENALSTAYVILKKLEAGANKQEILDIAKELKNNLGLPYFEIMNSELKEKGGIVFTSNCKEIISTSGKNIEEVEDYETPKLFVKNNTKTNNYIFDLSKDEFLKAAYSTKGAEIINSPTGSKGKTIVYLKCADELQETRLNAFDSIVHNAVCSVLHSGKKSFDLTSLAKVIYSDSEWGKAKLTDNRIEDIKNSLNKLSLTKVTLNYADHLKYKQLGVNESALLGSTNYLLPLKENIYIHPNKCITTRYKIIDEPPLFAYSTQAKQCLYYDNSLISVGNQGVPKNVGVLRLRRWLLDRVLIYRGAKKKSNYNVLLCSSIYDAYSDTPNSNLSKVQKKRVRDYTETTLKSWVEIGMLDKFTRQKKGNKIISYKFTINPDYDFELKEGLI